MIIFDRERCISICLKNKNKYVALAVGDLINDFKRVNSSGKAPAFTEKEDDFCIVIEENTTGTCNPVADEGFKLECQNGRVVISANGYLGTMWGIYTFSEKILGIDPCYLFNDLEITQREKIETEDFCIEDKPESFAFRGVFINDEDLLSGWKSGGGKRYIDFPFYSVTVDKSVMERVAETIVRLKFNLVIPASLLDIDNPPEKALADCIAKRGIYISQHHIEPLGLSSFSFENYCKKYGESGEFSYVKNAQVMEKAWEFYAGKWAKYDNVVWQIGLRGAGDRPVWQEKVPTDEDLREYGAFISKAYSRQKEIILKATGGRAKYFTSTLWMEGSKLMQKGYIDIPENTVTVFSDCGPNQMFGDEYDAVKREKGKEYGIYYHVQYCGAGPHIAPQTGLDKIYYNIGLAKSKGDNSYFILNASNIREFVFELKATSEMVWNFDKFSKSEYLKRYCSIFGEHSASAEKLITEYFASLPESDINKYHDKFFNFSYNTQADKTVKNFVLKDGLVLMRGGLLIERFNRVPANEKLTDTYTELKKAIPLFLELCEGFEKLAGEFSGPLRKHIEVKWLLYSKTLLLIYRWYVFLYEAKQYCEKFDGENTLKLLNSAVSSLEEYLQYRRCAEYSDFENWYSGDLKMNVKKYYSDTLRLLNKTAF